MVDQIMINSKKILFVSIYSETSKNIVSYINTCVNYGHKVDIIAKHYPFGNDKSKTEKIFDEYTYETLESLDLGDSRSWRNGPGLTSRWYRLLYTFLFSVLRHYKANKQARRILKSYKPDLLILCSDSRLLERFLIKNGSKYNIKSICLQWTLSVVSRTSIIESKKRVLDVPMKFTKAEILLNYIFALFSNLVRVYNGALFRVLNLRCRFDIPKTDGIRVHGQGNADALALIGKTSYDFHLSMGTPQKKLHIIGSPFYAQKYIDSLQSKLDNSNSLLVNEMIDKYQLVRNHKIILIANNDSRKQYTKYYTNEFIVQFWKETILEILKISNNITVIFKTHPVWNTIDEFSGLTSITPNFHLIHDEPLERLLEITDVLVVRHSMAGIEGIIHNIPTISMNMPSIPAGNFYKDIGGTFHVESPDALYSLIKCIINYEVSFFREYDHRRKIFLQNVLGIDSDLDASKFKIKINKLIEKLTSH